MSKASAGVHYLAMLTSREQHPIYQVGLHPACHSGVQLFSHLISTFGHNFSFYSSINDKQNLQAEMRDGMQEPFATELTDWYKRQVTVINSKL